MKYGFGIDVGGTSIKLGLFREDGVLQENGEIPTVIQDGGAAILPDIAIAMEACLRRHGLKKEDIIGVGIGVPGPVSSDGVVNCCSNLNWGIFNIQQELSAITGLPVKAGNDANCAALGEYFQGGGVGASSTLFVTLGTGIGGAFIVDGRVLNGAHGVFGEIGHITVNAPDRRLCTCGKRGCVEQYASAPAIVRITQECLERDPAPTLLRRLEKIQCKDVFDAAKAGDAFAEGVLDQVFDYLGQALASACCVCDPERVVLGGGVSNAGEQLRRGVERRFQKYMFHACEGTQFVLATLGNRAGMVGAFHML